MPISDAELAEARADAEDLLPDSATIQTLTTVSDGGGGETETWTDGSTVACRIAPIGGGEGGAKGERIEARTTHIVTVPAETEVEETSRLKIDDTTYEITLVRKRSYELTRRVEVTEAG